MQTDDNTESLITPQLSIIESQERANIDMLVSTAKRYPRDLARVKRTMEAMATLDEETAEGCNYCLRRKDKLGREVEIRGPSVRMAEIAVACYGNIRSGARIVGNDGKIITGQAYVHDLENNTFVAWETGRRVTDSKGRTYGEDMQVTTGNAAAAIAFRNAVFKVIPSAIIKPIAEKALHVAVGDVKTLTQRRTRAIKKFASVGVSESQLLTFLEKASVDQIDIADVENLFGIFTAIKEGTTTIEEQFPQTQEIKKPQFEEKPIDPPTKKNFEDLKAEVAKQPAPAPVTTPRAEMIVKAGAEREVKAKAEAKPETKQEPKAEPKFELIQTSNFAEQVREKVTAAGYTEVDVLAVLRPYALVTNERSLNEMSHGNLQTALNNWNTILAELKQKASGAHNDRSRH